MTARERRCSECGVPLVRREGESDGNWTARRYCSNPCASRGTAKAERAHTGATTNKPAATYQPTARCQNKDCGKPIVYTGRCYECATGRVRVLTPEALVAYAAAADRAGSGA